MRFRKKLGLTLTTVVAGTLLTIGLSEGYTYVSDNISDNVYPGIKRMSSDVYRWIKKTPEYLDRWFLEI